MDTTLTTNGKLRKSLGEQIDRLDGILDGLADNLNQAVASAVTQAVSVAVQQAIQGLLTEVLTNPKLLEQLRGFLAPTVPTVEQPTVAAEPVATQPSKPTWRQRLAKVGAWVSGKVRTFCGRCQSVLGMARVLAVAAGSKLAIVRRFKTQLLLAGGIGVVVGAAAYFAGPWLSAGLSAVGGFMTTLAVQAGWWLHRTFGSLRTYLD